MQLPVKYKLDVSGLLEVPVDELGFDHLTPYLWVAHRGTSTSIPVIPENGTPYRAYNANITDDLAWRFANSYLAPIPHFEKFREVFIYTRRSFTQLPEDIKISIARSLGISAFQLIFTQDEHDALRWHVVEEESQWTM